MWYFQPDLYCNTHHTGVSLFPGPTNSSVIIIVINQCLLEPALPGYTGVGGGGTL